MKLARTSSNEWWCWCFPTLEDKLCDIFPWVSLPRFRRVRKLHVNERDGNKFLWCDCGYYERVGFPCPHFFCLTGCMCLQNFHIRHWKMYEAFYGHDNDLGEMMIRCQVSLWLAIHLSNFQPNHCL